MVTSILFPTESERIQSEVARFRELSSSQQIHELEESFRLYHFLRQNSGRAEQIDKLAEEEESAARSAIMEFARNYG